MKRQEKYQDTQYFKFFNANPKNKITDDCVIRAISVGTGIPYEETLRNLFEVQLKTGYMINDDKCYSKYLEKLGYVKMNEPRKHDNTKMSVIEFIQYRRHKNCIAHVGSHHIVAIKDGQVYDIWNSSHQTMHVYWVK